MPANGPVNSYLRRCPANAAMFCLSDYPAWLVSRRSPGEVGVPRGSVATLTAWAPCHDKGRIPTMDVSATGISRIFVASSPTCQGLFLNPWPRTLPKTWRNDWGSSPRIDDHSNEARTCTDSLSLFFRPRKKPMSIPK